MGAHKLFKNIDVSYHTNNIKVKLPLKLAKYKLVFCYIFACIFALRKKLYHICIFRKAIIDTK